MGMKKKTSAKKKKTSAKRTKKYGGLMGKTQNAIQRRMKYLKGL